MSYDFRCARKLCKVGILKAAPQGVHRAGTDHLDHAGAFGRPRKSVRPTTAAVICPATRPRGNHLRRRSSAHRTANRQCSIRLGMGESLIRLMILCNRHALGNRAATIDVCQELVRSRPVGRCHNVGEEISASTCLRSGTPGPISAAREWRSWWLATCPRLPCT
jgi:hypothetical protein